jgi:hypothetical protein
MRKIVCSIAVLALLAFVSAATAEEIKSGLESGERIGAFNVTKLAGADEDGVEVGKNLCYRCKNGGRPQVLIFTRSSDEKVVSLVKELDAAITKNSDKELCAFVNYIGEDKSSATEDAKKLAKSTGAKNVPFVLPNEFENGPDNYGINAKADVTILLVEGGTVVANHAYQSGKEVEVDAVIGDLSKILK